MSACPEVIHIKGLSQCLVHRKDPKVPCNGNSRKEGEEEGEGETRLGRKWIPEVEEGSESGV